MIMTANGGQGLTCSWRNFETDGEGRIGAAIFPPITVFVRIPQHFGLGFAWGYTRR